MKSEKLIRNYIMRTLNETAFTWTIDIMEHSIWGFKNAPYKNFIRALNKVNSVVNEMIEEGIVIIDKALGDKNYTITPGKYFNE